MKYYYHFLAFIGGFNIMLIEMCGFRVLQIHFGSSIYVTGLLLATIMVSLSLGYYCGGKISEKAKDLKPLLFPLIAAAGYICLFDIFLSGKICSLLFRLGGHVGYKVIPPSAATIILFSFPMLVLSLITPFLIKWLTINRQSLQLPTLGVGEIAGQLMAISTIGSVIGTLVTSFVFLPFIGIKLTYVIAIGLTLVAVTAGFYLSGLPGKRIGSIGTLAIILVMALIISAPKSNKDTVYEGESLYGHVDLRIHKAGTRDEVIVYKPSNIYTHTVYYPNNRLRNYFFLEFINYGLLFHAENYLMLGSGGGAVMKLLPELDSQASIIGVELDPTIIDISKKYFGVMTNEKVRLIDDDARAYLEKNKTKFDYVMVDVFRNDSIPAHCITKEFYDLVFSRLNDDGILFVNTNLLWQFLTTGLENYYDPLAHFCSTLFQAGFQSIYYNNHYNLGLLYAFKTKTSLTEIREKIKKEIADEKLDIDARISLALNYFSTIPVDEQWQNDSPFLDDSVPVHLIYSVDLRKFGGYEKRFRKAFNHPVWKKRRKNDNPDLKMITLRYLETKFNSPEQKQLNKSKYAQDILEWLAANDGLSSQAVIKYGLLREVEEHLLSNAEFVSDPKYKEVYHLILGQKLALAGVENGDREMLEEALLHLQKAM